MRQAIAFWLIILFSAMADGIMEAFDLGGFMIVGAAVLTVAAMSTRQSEVRQ